MTAQDIHGRLHTGAAPNSMQSYEAALRGFQRFAGDPVGLLGQAIDASPAFVMAHVARAYMFMIGTDPGPREMVAAALPDLRRLPASSWEKAHIEAVSRLTRNELHACARLLEEIAIDDPHDILAIQIGHLLDLMTGDTRMLRDRVARALPAWSADAPGYSAMLGMLAFGFEEAGDYARAEATGRRAVELDPRDSWAQHAVAHVYEMQGRTTDGLAWMLNGHERWSQDNFFHVHNWWHTALYHLELGDTDEVLRLFDGPIYGQRSGLVFDMVDASALLWRLMLRGQDLGDRWEALADNWDKTATDTRFAFNDAHAMMAFASAGRASSIARLRQSQHDAIAAPGEYAATLAAVGRSISEGIASFAAGDYRLTVDLLQPARNAAIRFGGSHAQRDIIDLTLIEAALRSGETSLARALTSERVLAKPDIASARALVRRALNDAAQKAA